MEIDEEPAERFARLRRGKWLDNSRDLSEVMLQGEHDEPVQTNERLMVL